MSAIYPAVAETRFGSFRGGVWVWVLAGWGLVVTGSSPAQPAPPPVLGVAYLAELPLSWRTGHADPLRNIARSLGTAFARPVNLEFPQPAENLFAAESWDELSRTIQQAGGEGGGQLFPLHGYEVVEKARALNLKPLLFAARNGSWSTRFVILASAASQIQSLQNLEGRKLLVHRDGCGNLVDHWLDDAIAVGTGKQRKGFARYVTVTEAREAVLPVFFGEAEACVVSVAAYQSVVLQNPVQIPGKMIPLAKSKELPMQVVACRLDLPVDVQRRVLEQTASLAWEIDGKTGSFVPAEEIAFDNLRVMLAERPQPLKAPLPALGLPRGGKPPRSLPAKLATHP